jgi:GntR family transcriptional regulator
MAIWLNVDPRSGIPLYLQLIDGVKRALAIGSLQPGDRLPTVQKLSSELTIAPNTIVKAYAELQRLGLIESRAGAGTVVAAAAPHSVRGAQLQALDDRLTELIRDAQALGVDRQDLAARFAAALVNSEPPGPPGDRPTQEVPKQEVTDE